MIDKMVERMDKCQIWHFQWIKENKQKNYFYKLIIINMTDKMYNRKEDKFQIGTFNELKKINRKELFLQINNKYDR